MSAFRYWMWEATARAGGGESFTHANEFYLIAAGSRIAASTVVGLDPNTPFGAPSMLNDNNTTTRHLSGSTYSFKIKFDYGSAQTPDAYTWWTGPDATDRDPVSWKLWASNDNVNWTLADTQTGVAVTATRNANAGPWSFTPPADPGPPVRSGGVTYRWFKFTPTAVRGGGGSACQYGEFWMMSEGARIASTSQSSPFSPASNGDDWDARSKIIDGSLANCVLTLDMGSSQNFDGYAYVTADDSNDRDPISWTLEGSNISSTGAWTLLDTQTSVTITTDRMALAGTWPLSGGAPPATSLIIPRRRQLYQRGLIISARGR